MRGIPAPFPKAVGDNALGRFLVSVNQLGIRVLRGVFSYQIYVRARALPTVSTLLRQTQQSSEELRRVAIAG
jgi:hypothetical protein